MHSTVVVRPVQAEDYAAWRPLWDGYNGFYGRFGATALPEHITQTTWQRLLDPAEPVFCLVAHDKQSGEMLGLAHYVFHRSLTRIEPVCYLSDLFTREAARGRGVGRALIDAVVGAARAAKSTRVYWQTHESNAAGRLLYDKLAQHHGFIVYAREL
ncbi:MAG: GNAT family N-acetyltransferase [Gammaproteobacteria bacterium]|nr:GNAT family N-acetyltransferase [Gammaproteobacteria bacterium]MBU1508322.1 GNAT family N-acetyltransferase [Gammaproteobacteria bacterium]MBU2122145.1 GNAT family N-acetyltransferase [Gammaproteobacteria bacterium]MBU2169786.1 GNAT family N-acetyltransferase [Gammaproteobacteria bacterium]MBU2199630.1 GNAT family N-acetyltransferase [Gammaproteobacteria bacterium]